MILGAEFVLGQLHVIPRIASSDSKILETYSQPGLWFLSWRVVLSPSLMKDHFINVTSGKDMAGSRRYIDLQETTAAAVLVKEDA